MAWLYPSKRQLVSLRSWSRGGAPEVGELYALMSASGSPGVTTTAIALALTWPAAAIVAECDPSGGDVLAGVLAGHVPARQGLIEHAIEAGRGRWAADVDLAAQLVPLDAGQTKKVLPGLSDPRQAAGVAADRKSTRLNSSHVKISYAVFC